MSKKKKRKPMPDLSPDERLAAKFDATGVAKFPVSGKGKTVPIVRDNCAEEHIM